MKNTIKMTVAAVLAAATMSSAIAGIVPGLPGGLFESNGVGTAGNVSVTKISSILTSVYGTSGSEIDQTKFWQSFVDDKKTQTFDYEAAKPLISELIFTVLGEVIETDTSLSNAGEWVTANETRIGSYSNKISEISRIHGQSELEQMAGFKVGDVKVAEVMTGDTVTTPEELYTLSDVEAHTGLSTTVAQKGNYLNGQLKVTGENAIELLRALNFRVTSSVDADLDITDLGRHTCQDPVAPTATNGGCADLTAGGDLNEDTKVGNTNIVMSNDWLVAASPSVTTEVSTYILGSNGGFTTLVNNANLNEGAFINTNLLIKEISKQLKNGYILDVAAATAAVTKIIVQHNAFLGASVVREAHKIKNTIKLLGLQVAAAGVAKGAQISCEATSGTITTSGKACVAIGSKFQDIVQDIGTIDSAQVAADYNTALDTINGFANDLIAFNDASVAGGYNSSLAEGSIKGQYGTITVVVDTDDNDATDTFYESLVKNDIETGGDGSGGTGNPVSFESWTTTTVTDFEGFDASLDIFDGETVELF